LHRPANDTAGVEIDHHGEVGEAVLCPKLGHVRESGLVGRFHVELSLQRIINDDRGSAAMACRPAPVADLGSDAG